ncbi:MAG: hypothetical protein ACFFFH_18430 [Candidatus Thorarchaeota archaeon]
MHNSSRGNYGNNDVGKSRYVEIEVDEETYNAKEVWSWAPKGDYYSLHGDMLIVCLVGILLVVLVDDILVWML